MKTTKLIYHMSSGVVYVVSFVILTILTITNLRFSTYVMNIREHITVRSTNLWLIAGNLVILLLLFYLIVKYSEKIDEKKLFLLFSMIYFVMGIYLIMNINCVLRYDALSVHDASIAMHRGDFSTMDRGHYTYRYPHQLGFLIYEYLIGFISHDAKLLFGINLIAVLVINFFMYQIAKEIFENQHKINLVTITLSFLFFPQFFFITFAYGLIPGFCLLMIGIYCLLRFVRTEKWKWMILSGIFLMLAVLMKKNFIIAMVACLCYLLLQWLQKKDKKFLDFMLLIVVIFVIGKMTMTKGFESYSGKKVNEGVPSILWVAMGTDPKNHKRSGGWYDKKYVNVYKNTNFDRKRSAKIGEEMVAGYFKYYKKYPARAYRFFGKKITTTWTDPLYESIFSGPKQEAGQYVKIKYLYHLFNEEKYDTALYIVMKAYIILLMISTWIFVWKYLKEYEKANLGMIFLIGGFLFHLFWETKGQYVYPYIFMQIPASSYVIVKIFEKKTA